MTRNRVAFIAAVVVGGMLIAGGLLEGTGAWAQTYSQQATPSNTPSAPMQEGLLTKVVDNETVEIDNENYPLYRDYEIWDKEGNKRTLEDLKTVQVIRYRLWQGFIDRIECSCPPMKKR